MLDGAVHRQIRGQARRVTISDVARALDLTKGTVSRALNGYSDISESTRLRVAKKAEAMGYRPLSHAQAIRTGRVRAIGLVLQTSEHDAHGPFLTDFLAGVTRAASDAGWSLTVSTATDDANMIEVMGRLIAEKKADGFILPRTRVDDPRVDFLAREGVPGVLYGRTAYGDPDAGKPLSWYDILGEDAMRDAVLRFAKMGHQRIGFVGGGHGYNYAPLRRDGYLAGLHKAGLPIDETLMTTGARMPEDGARATHELLAHDQPPTAIVFATDKPALGAWSAAKELGLTIGRDVSVIGYDGIPEGAYAEPGLTTFSVDSQRAGARLAELLIQLCLGNNEHPLKEHAPASLVVRGSDGPPRLSSEELAAHLRRTTGH